MKHALLAAILSAAATCPWAAAAQNPLSTPRLQQEYELAGRRGCQSIVSLNSGTNQMERLLLIRETSGSGEEAFYVARIGLVPDVNDAPATVLLAGVKDARDAVALRRGEFAVLSKAKDGQVVSRWVNNKVAEDAPAVKVFAGASGLARSGSDRLLVFGHEGATPRIDEYGAGPDAVRSASLSRFPNARVFELLRFRDGLLATIIQALEKNEQRTVLVRLSADLRILSEQVISESLARISVNESSRVIAAGYYESGSAGVFAASAALFDEQLQPLKPLSLIENPMMGVVAPAVALGERSLWYMGSKHYRTILHLVDLQDYSVQKPRLRPGNRIAPADYQYAAAYGSHALMLAENRRLEGSDPASITQCNGVWVQRWER